MSEQEPKAFAKSALQNNPGSKIAVIKEVREAFGLGLKEAKELVDIAQGELVHEDPSFAEQATSKGCLPLLLMLVVPAAYFMVTSIGLV